MTRERSWWSPLHKMYRFATGALFGESAREWEDPSAERSSELRKRFYLLREAELRQIATYRKINKICAAIVLTAAYLMFNIVLHRAFGSSPGLDWVCVIVGSALFAFPLVIGTHVTFLGREYDHHTDESKFAFGPRINPAELMANGRVVAEALGGREIFAFTQDRQAQCAYGMVQLLSVTYELPHLPAVYVIEGTGINSFIIGQRGGDIVIGVTRGLLALPPARVQSVLAHQLFFVLYGDMRLNSRLFQYSGGISAFAMLASLMVSCHERVNTYAPHHHEESLKNLETMVLETPDAPDQRSLPPAPSASFFSTGGLEVLLLCIGVLGWIANRLLQASLLRTCRLAADAHAVQFTGNPQAFLDLLDDIRCRGSEVRSLYLYRHWEQLSWLFFADVRPRLHQLKSIKQNRWSSLVEALFSPHPPIVQRLKNICRLLPEHESKAPVAAAAPAHDGGPRHPAAAATRTAEGGGQRDAGAARAVADAAFDVADGDIPQPLRAAARDPMQARAVALLPLLAHDHALREEQLILIDPMLAEQARQLWPHWQKLDPDRDLWRLLHCVAPALASLVPVQRCVLWSAACNLISADKVLTISEFIALRSLERLLAERRPAAPSPVPPSACQDELALIFAHVAFAAGSRIAPQVYQDAWRRVAPQVPAPPAPPVPDGYALGKALDRVHALEEAGKRAVLAAIVHAVTAPSKTVRPLAANLIILLAREFGLPDPALAIDTACVLDE